MRNFAALALMLCIASFPLQAQWTERSSGVPAPDAPNRKHDGETGAMLVLTASPKEFLDEWYGTPHDVTPALRAASVAHRGDSVAAFVLFTGCCPKGEMCNAEVDFEVLRPDGSVYGRVPGSPAWGRAAPAMDSVLLSEAHMLIRLEPADPFGKYTVRAVFRVPGRKSIELESTLSVESKPDA